MGFRRSSLRSENNLLVLAAWSGCDWGGGLRRPHPGHISLISSGPGNHRSQRGRPWKTFLDSQRGRNKDYRQGQGEDARGLSFMENQSGGKGTREKTSVLGKMEACLVPISIQHKEMSRKRQLS